MRNTEVTSLNMKLHHAHHILDKRPRHSQSYIGLVTSMPNLKFLCSLNTQEHPGASQASEERSLDYDVRRGVHIT